MCDNLIGFSLDIADNLLTRILNIHYVHRKK